jgi:hypothetical protein
MTGVERLRGAASSDGLMYLAGYNLVRLPGSRGVVSQRIAWTHSRCSVSP